MLTITNDDIQAIAEAVASRIVPILSTMERSAVALESLSDLEIRARVDHERAVRRSVEREARKAGRRTA